MQMEANGMPYLFRELDDNSESSVFIYLSRR